MNLIKYMGMAAALTALSSTVVAQNTATVYLKDGSTIQYNVSAVDSIVFLPESESPIGVMANMTVKNGLSYESYALAPVTGEYLEFFMSEYSLLASQIASVTVPVSASAGTPIVIYPNMDDLADLMILDINGVRSDIAFEASEDAEGKMYVMITVPIGTTEPLWVVFKDSNMVNQRLLMVTPEAEAVTGMTVTNGVTLESYTMGDVTGDYKDFFVSEYSVLPENLASVTVPAGTPLTIDPKMGEALGNVMAFDSQLQPIADFYMEPTMDMEGNLVVMVRVPESASDFIYLVFQKLTDTEDLINEKVLLINIGKAAPEGAMADMTVKNGLSYDALTVAPVTGEYLEFFMSEYSLEANQIASVTAAPGTPIVIYPNMEDLADLMVLDINGVRSDIAFEPSEDAQGNMYVMVTVPVNATEPFWIVFKNSNMVNQRLLMVVPEVQ